jgi:hypothetical protein
VYNFLNIANEMGIWKEERKRHRAVEIEKEGDTP